MRSKTSDAIIKSDSITAAIEAYFKRYKSSTKAWSFCLYSSLFGAAALSAWAGILPQLNSHAKNIATVLAVTASLVNTISGIGRFDQKWQASRRARADVEALHIAMLEKKENSGVGEQLEQIIVNQSAGVIGSHSLSDNGRDTTAQPKLKNGDIKQRPEQEHGQVVLQKEGGSAGAETPGVGGQPEVPEDTSP